MKKKLNKKLNWKVILIVVVVLCLFGLFGNSDDKDGMGINAIEVSSETESVLKTESEDLVSGYAHKEVETEIIVETEIVGETEEFSFKPTLESAQTFSLADVPEYSGNPYVAINDYVPFFTDEEKSYIEPFEMFSPLDDLGRCGVVYANVCQELMPTEDRGNIGQVKPTGWKTAKYEGVDGNYLYNRCHLLGFQLTGENANEKNLITGTRYMNVEGMLPFENMVADYVKETGNHVLYRVTPIFEGNNLVASGVLMEAYSVEDEGDGIMFNVYCYNVQPNIAIDYVTGDSEVAVVETQAPIVDTGKDYVINVNSGKFHHSYCASASEIKPENRRDYHGSRDDLVAQGYKPCKNCNP